MDRPDKLRPVTVAGRHRPAWTCRVRFGAEEFEARVGVGWLSEQREGACQGKAKKKKSR